MTIVILSLIYLFTLLFVYKMFIVKLVFRVVAYYMFIDLFLFYAKYFDKLNDCYTNVIVLSSSMRCINVLLSISYDCLKVAKFFHLEYMCKWPA